MRAACLDATIHQDTTHCRQEITEKTATTQMAILLNFLVRVFTFFSVDFLLSICFLAHTHTELFSIVFRSSSICLVLLPALCSDASVVCKCVRVCDSFNVRGSLPARQSLCENGQINERNRKKHYDLYYEKCTESANSARARHAKQNDVPILNGAFFCSVARLVANIFAYGRSYEECCWNCVRHSQCSCSVMRQ